MYFRYLPFTIYQLSIPNHFDSSVIIFGKYIVCIVPEKYENIIDIMKNFPFLQPIVGGIDIASSPPTLSPVALEVS